MSVRSKVGVTVKAVPVPRVLVRAQIAGEVINACGGSAAEVEIGQKGVSRQMLEKVIVFGIDSEGCAREKIEFAFTGDASGDITLDLDGGNRSAIEAMDAGLARAVAYAAERIRRRGLTPDVRYVFTGEICADAERLASARAELGVGPSDTPKWRDAYEDKEVLRLKPGKDNGILGSFFRDFGK